MSKVWLIIPLFLLFFVNIQSVVATEFPEYYLYFDGGIEGSDPPTGILNLRGGDPISDMNLLIFGGVLPSYGITNLDEYGIPLDEYGNPSINVGSNQYYLLNDPPILYVYFDGELVLTNIMMVTLDIENPNHLFYQEYANRGIRFRPPFMGLLTARPYTVLFRLVWKDTTITRIGIYKVTEDFTPTSIWGLIPSQWWTYFPSEYKDYIKGDQGIQGIQGIQGTQGIQGVEGDIGPKGKDAENVPTNLIYLSLGISVVCLFVAFNRNYKVEKRSKT